MRKIMLAAAILIPLLELFIFAVVVNGIGVWWTILFMIATSVLGFALAKRQGLQILRLAQLQVQKGQVPSGVMLDGLCIFIGGAFLILPGFLTDIVGLVFLVPWTRTIFKALLLKLIHNAISKGQFMVIKRR
ncbi:FxsA family protein [Shouchella shacheensis]|uniref:FxsA family protein n=1 Tax=Shouchella shacheensis TaxID=1649580 RepID=UPI0007402A36|nr:FxsA family protein [Shouchella shacheensis]